MLLSGQITVTTAGTAVQGTATPLLLAVRVAAHPANTGVIWVGDGDPVGNWVTSTSGFPLNPGTSIELPGNLKQYWFDAAVSGEKACWIVATK
jgi:hypothetical protein